MPAIMQAAGRCAVLSLLAAPVARSVLLQEGASYDMQLRGDGTNKAKEGLTLSRIVAVDRTGNEGNDVKVVHHKSWDNEEKIDGIQFATVLRRPIYSSSESLTESDTTVQGKSSNLVDKSGLRYASVSPSQLKALKEWRKQDRKASLHETGATPSSSKASPNGIGQYDKDEDDKPEDIAKTILTSLAATEYVGPIGIGTIHEPKGCDSLVGTPAGEGVKCVSKEQQALKVVFDTGSTNLWMASTLCVEGPCVSQGRMRYDNGKSETYQDPEVPRNLTINFATATLIGPVGVDQFHIGPFAVKNQTFGLIQEEQGNTFTELPLEGIVGLAFPSMSAGGVKTFFDNVIDQRLLKKNLFAFYLSPTDGPGPSSMFEGIGGLHKEYQPGMDALLWGGVDKQLFEGDLVWFPVTQAHYWALDLHGFFIGNQSMEFMDADTGRHSLTEKTTGAPAKLIVDSGTAYYTAEDYLYRNFMSTLQCDDQRAPDLTYRLKSTDGKDYDLVIAHEDYMVGHCEPGYVKIPVPQQFGPAMLLGELFMRKFFTVFDRGDGSDAAGRIGFARSKPGADIAGQLKADDSASGLFQRWER